MVQRGYTDSVVLNTSELQYDISAVWYIISKFWLPLYEHSRMAEAPPPTRHLTNVLHSIRNSKHLSSLNSESCKASKGPKGHSVWNSFLRKQCVCPIYWHFESYLRGSKVTLQRPQHATGEITFKAQLRGTMVSSKMLFTLFTWIPSRPFNILQLPEFIGYRCWLFLIECRTLFEMPR